MKRKIRIFKNDPFGIKEKYFRWSVRRHVKKSIEVYTKALRVYLNIVNTIIIPRNDEEIEILKRVIKAYDETVLKLEENLTHARIYISGESEVSE